MSTHRLQLSYSHAPRSRAVLYGVVYGTVYVKVAVCLLLLFSFMQPIANAYANETTDSGSAAEAPTPPPVSPPEATEPITSVAQSEVEEDTERDNDAAEMPKEEPVESTEVPEPTVITIDEPAIESATEETHEPAPTPEVRASSSVSETRGTSSSEVALPEGSASATTSEREVATSSDTIPLSGSTGSNPEQASDNDATTTASTTTPAQPQPDSTTELPPTPTTPESEESDAVTEADGDETGDTFEVGSATATQPAVITSLTFTDDTNRLQFGVDECVTVGGGAYYCHKESDRTSVVAPAQVYSSAEGGDGEIFWHDGKKLHQLTDNGFEDSNPRMDREGNRVVFQRLIKGVQQIVSYDLNSNTETQLTSSDTNNMEPVSEGDYTVWQRWLNENWEIILHDGTNEMQLTNNSSHDVAPDIQGGFITWHTTGAPSGRAVTVYEIATGLTSTIADSDGGQVLNPRFVLVYDTKFDNGDVITKGYDPATGELVPLAAQPGEPVVPVPTPEPTGETPALLQNKTTTSREDFSDIDPTTPSSTGSSTPPNSATTSAATVLDEGETPSVPDLIIEAASSTGEADDVIPLTEFDLIVEPYVPAESSQESGTTSSAGSVE